MKNKIEYKRHQLCILVNGDGRYRLRIIGIDNGRVIELPVRSFSEASAKAKELIDTLAAA